MKSMPRTVLGLLLVICTFPAVCQSDDEKPPAGGQNAEAAPLRFPLYPQRAPYFGRVESVAPDGKVQISDILRPVPANARPEITEGYYLGILQEQAGARFVEARLVRVLVTDVGDGVAQLQVGKAAAAALQGGETLALYRPRGATTAQLKELPDLAPLEEGPIPGGNKDAQNQAQLAQSFNNLKQIGLALHNFHDMFAHFPPAVVLGPDGKPWHSWRVFLLPYLDAQLVYSDYDFDEPWNGPNNSKLLARMPDAFSDPAYGENKEFYTHYAAVTGKGMAFSAEGVKSEGKPVGEWFQEGRAVRDFTDGTSNSLIVGPVSPDRKIPWMKPEDIEVGDDFPELGAKGSFALPYKTSQGNAGPFLRADGSVLAILGSADMKTLRPFLTISGGEPVDWNRVPSITSQSFGRTMTVIYVIKQGNKTSAVSAKEPWDPGADNPQLNPPGGLPRLAPAPRPPGALKKLQER